MRYLLDTDVLSELVKRRPDAREWSSPHSSRAGCSAWRAGVRPVDG